MKLLLGLKALALVAICSVSASANFITTSSNVRAIDLGVFTKTNVLVNKFDSLGNLVTTTGNYSGATPTAGSVYSQSFSGSYRAVLIAPTVSGQNYTVSFGTHRVLAVVASNGWDNGSTGTMAANVWASHAYLGGAGGVLDLGLRNLLSMTASQTAGIVSTTLSSGIFREGTQGFEIHRATQPGGSAATTNPDELKLTTAFSIQANVNAIGSPPANELHLVLVEVPEPATVAIWGLASVVGMGAFRLRRRFARS